MSPESIILKSFSNKKEIKETLAKYNNATYPQ